WVFGVNALPFPLTRGPVPPRLLPSFCREHFRHRGHGQGLVEYGSTFYDFFFVALQCARGLAHAAPRGSLPATPPLLWAGCPSGGTYRAGDVRPMVEEARARGVRFKVAGFVLRRYRAAMEGFRESLGLTDEELEVAWYDTDEPDQLTIDSSFVSLSH